MSKKFYRKGNVAARYDVNPRTVERMVLDGRLPPPVYRGRIPLWDGTQLDISDRAAALAPRRSKQLSQKLKNKNTDLGRAVISRFLFQPQ